MGRVGGGEGVGDGEGEDRVGGGARSALRGEQQATQGTVHSTSKQQ